MGYSLNAASQNRDSPVDEYLHSSRRGLVSLEDRQNLAMLTDWSPLGGRKAGEPLMGGMYRGHIPYRHCFSIYLPERDTWISVPSLPLSSIQGVCDMISECLSGCSFKMVTFEQLIIMFYHAPFLHQL